jgi:hypothetical protein
MAASQADVHQGFAAIAVFQAPGQRTQWLDGFSGQA